MTIDENWNIITICAYVCILSEKNGNEKNLKDHDTFRTMSDEQIVSLAQAGDEAAMEFIVGKYASFVRLRSGPYFLAGADKDDLVQEGLIGLYKAVKSFDSQKRACFKTFAEVCVVRQMITAVKSSTRKKNQPLNHYVSIHGTDGDAREDSRLDSLVDLKNINPESIMIEKENAEGMASDISALLSRFELQVLALYLQGFSYQKIAEVLGKDSKSVDNALSRIKKKTEKYISGE